MENPESELQWPVIVKLAKITGLVLSVLVFVALLQFGLQYKWPTKTWIPSIAHTEPGHPGIVAAEHLAPSKISFTFIDVDESCDHVAMVPPVRPDWNSIANFNIAASPSYGGPTGSNFLFGFLANCESTPAGLSDSRGLPPEVPARIVNGIQSQSMSPCLKVVIRNDGSKTCTCTGIGLLVVARHLHKATGYAMHRSVEVPEFDGTAIDENPPINGWLLQTFSTPVEIAPKTVFGQKLQLKHWMSWDPSVIQIIFKIDGVHVLSPEIFIGAS